MHPNVSVILMNNLDFYLLKELHWILDAFFLRLVACSFIKAYLWSINTYIHTSFRSVSVIPIPPFSHCWPHSDPFPAFQKLKVMQPFARCLSYS